MIRKRELRSLPSFADWRRARYVRYKGTTMIRCNNATGEQVAVYQHRSEAETYWRNSVPGAKFDDADWENNAVVIVTDQDGNEVGEIVGPKQRRDSATRDDTSSPRTE